MVKKAADVIILLILFFMPKNGFASVNFDGKTWYDSHSPSTMSINSDGQLKWVPYNDHQIITRLPSQRLSVIGDVAEISYLWLSDGQGNIAGCEDCQNEATCQFNKDITCVSGTGDFRVGLFESDGDYITADGMGLTNEIFRGYKGYKFCMQPHVPETPVRWQQADGEPHIAGGFYERDMVDDPRLMTVNEVFDRISMFGGYDLPLNTWSLWTIRLERLSSTSIKMSMTLNGLTYTDIDTTDSASIPQPRKIDVFAIDFANPNPYTKVVFDIPCEPNPLDFDENGTVDENDLMLFSNDWLKGAGRCPDPNRLVIHYTFDETTGSTAYNSSVAAYDGAVQVVSTGIAMTNAWDPAVYDGKGCINFDGNTKVTVSSASTAFAGVNSAASVSLWINGNAAVQPDPASGMAFQAVKTGSDRVLLAHIPALSNAGVMFDSGGLFAQRLFWTGATAADWEGQWNHYVFTVDTVAGTTNIYCNGDKKAWKAATAGVDGITGFMVGNGVLGSTNYEYHGKIDDFRIYDYALSDDEVLYIAKDGPISIITPPLDSKANLYNDDIIDLKDFAEFALQWLSTCQ